jgi:hypothetical protein
MTKNDWHFYARIVAAVIFSTTAMLGIAWYVHIGLWAFAGITLGATIIPGLIGIALSKWTKMSFRSISWVEIVATQALFTAGMLFVSTSWLTAGLSLALLPILTIASFISPAEANEEEGGIDLSDEASKLMDKIMSKMSAKDIEDAVLA